MYAPAIHKTNFSVQIFSMAGGVVEKLPSCYSGINYLPQELISHNFWRYKVSGSVERIFNLQLSLGLGLLYHESSLFTSKPFLQQAPRLQLGHHQQEFELIFPGILLDYGLDNTRLFISLTAGAGTRCMSLLSSPPSLSNERKFMPVLPAPGG